MRNSENGKSNRQIKGGATFVETGGREIDDKFLAPWKREARIIDGGTNTIATFGNGFAGHANNIEAGKPAVSVAFDGDKIGANAGGDSGVYVVGHGRSIGVASFT